MTSRTALALTIAALLAACGPGEKPVDDQSVQPLPTTTTAATATHDAPASVQARPDVNIPSNGLALWLAADELVTTGADDVVTMWRSPNNMRATQTTEGARPRLYADAINGKPAVRFDGDNDILQTNLNINPAVMQNVTVIAVFNSRVAEAEQRKVYGHDDGEFDRAAGLDPRGQSANYAIFGGSAEVVPYFTLAANTTYLTVDAYSPAAISGWVNGAKKIDNVAAKHGAGLPHLYIGGSGTAFQEPWAGDVAEVLVYIRALSDAERMQVEDYLAKKYGVALAR